MPNWGAHSIQKLDTHNQWLCYSAQFNTPWKQDENQGRRKNIKNGKQIHQIR